MKEMINPRFFWPRAVWLLLVLLLAGCGADGYRVHVESYNYAPPAAKKFVVLPGVMEVKADDQDYKAVSAQLANLMVTKGYVQAPGLDEADLALYVTYVKEKALPNAPRRFWHGMEIMSPENWRLTLEAVDLAKYKANDPKYMQWRIKAICYDADPSIAKTIPYLIAAMSDYVGRGGDVNLEVDDKMNVKATKAKGHQYN